MSECTYYLDMTPTNTQQLEQLGVSELRSMLDQRPDVAIVDVRTPGEFAAGHIAGSHNVPLAALETHGRELAALDRKLVLVCQSGTRASDAHQQLSDYGATDLGVLRGGIDSWAGAGEDTAALGGDIWPLERQIRLVAGSLTLTGILASLVVPKAKFLAGAIGAGLTFSALSNTCAMGNLLSRLPYNQPASHEIATTIGELRRNDEAVGA